jgi:Ca-activated chloride channel family protein
MNTDDPKFTAYALGEFEDLTPAERAEIAALLASDKEAAQEAETMHALAARLRRDLQAEESAPLTEEQRASVLAAKVVPVDFGNAASAPRRRSWRGLAPLAMAASVALCAVIAWKAEFSPKVHQERVVATDVPEAPGRPATPVEPVATAMSVEVAEQPLPESVVGASYASGAETPPSPVLADAVAQSGATKLMETQAGAAPSAAGAPSPAGASSGAGGRANRAMEGGLPTVRAAFTPAPFQLQEPATESANRKPELAKAATPEKAGARSQNEFAAATAKKTLTLGKDEETGLAMDGKAKRDEQAALSPEPRAATTGVPASVMVPRNSTPAADVEEMAQMKAGAMMNAPSPLVMPADAPGGHFGAAPKPRQAQQEAQLARYYDEIKPSGADEKLSWRREREADDSTAESYDFMADNPFTTVGQAPLSTFSIDVDTASYAIVRRFLNEQRLPPKGAVRVEELINYFSYDYPQPEGDAPFSATMEVAACPWAPEHRLVRIGLKGREIDKDKRPPSNLVFLIDVSGSMQPANKLPLLKQSLGLMIDQLGPKDQVAMAVYAGSSGTVLQPTHNKEKMREALGKLEAGGSTNGASGVKLAYQLAEESFIKGGTNRVVLATDGDWNVGITRPDDLFDLITKKAKSGVFLTVLGYGMDNLKDSMLVKLADKGNGNYGYIDTLLEAKKMLSDELTSTLVTIAKDVKIQVEFNPTQVAAYRLIGYEKRMLAKEDFNNDAKDAGEIGAGHTVTALYEVIPAGGDVPKLSQTDELKYQRPEPVEKPTEVRRTKLSEEVGKEMLTLKLRYKAPDGDVSKLLEFPLTDTGATWEKSSRDFRFAAAVASYGMLLRDSPHKGTTTWNSVRELAVEGQGKDPTGYRAEFITLVEKARALAR